MIHLESYQDYAVLPRVTPQKHNGLFDQHTVVISMVVRELEETSESENSSAARRNSETEDVPFVELQ
jgi:hypothetical protein